MPILQSITGRIHSGLSRFLSRSAEAPAGTRYIAIGESIDGFTLPDEQTNDRHFVSINAPGVDPNASAVVLYRTAHTGHPSFRATLNGTDLTHRTFSDIDPHAWHRVVPPGTLKPEDNEMAFTVLEGGTVTFSDVVILYTLNESR